MKCSLPLIVLLSGFAGAFCASAQVIVSDPFDDGNRTNGTDPLDLAWYKDEISGSMTIANRSTLATGAVAQGSNSLFMDPNSTFRSIFAGFAPFTLGAAGSSTDTITLALDFRFSTLGNVGSGYRLGLSNSLGTGYTADTVTANRNDDRGHGLAFSLGTATPGTSLLRDAGTESGPLSGADRTTLTTVGDIELSINDTTAHSVRLTYRRLSSSSLAITAEIFSSTGLSGSLIGFSTGTSTGLASDMFTFDQVGLGTGSVDANSAIDNVIIAAVPEARTCMAVMLGGLLLLVTRRRPCR